MSGDTDYTNVLLARLGSGGGTGAAGTATSANQLSQLGIETDIRDRIGEIQANPTANTLADRIKTLATLLAGGLPAVLIGGRLSVSDDVPARTPTTAQVASSATSVTLLAANANRKGVTIQNRSTALLYLSFTTPATIANAFVDIAPGAFFSQDLQLHTVGAIYGIWSAADGTAQVTEYV